jgi:ankyrin repeat protein
MGNHLCGTLHGASPIGHLECIITLLDRGADVNEKDNCGLTPLHWASSRGYSRCVRTLLDHFLLRNGADGNRTNVNEKDVKGWTPLHYASFNGNEECIKILLDYNANFNEKNNEGKTPIELAFQTTKEVFNKWIEDNELPIKEPCEE